MQRLLGHTVPGLLLRRDLFSILSACYAFAREKSCVNIRPWGSVKREARWMSHMLVFASSDLRRPLSTIVSCSDASLTGYAVCDAVFPEPLVRSVWARDPHVCARAVVLSLDSLTNVDTVRIPPPAMADPYEMNPDFSETPKIMVDQSAWRLKYATPFQFSDRIMPLEARGVLGSVKHRLRSLSSFGHCFLHLGDNLGLTLGLEKG
eukprot:5290099-Amphidinium_carterae.1